MLGIFSMTDNVPKIHCVVSDRSSAIFALKREVESTTKLNNTDFLTFENYPCVSYLKENEDLYAIYRHTAEQTIQRGWLWDGKPKQKIVSEKIGTFQIIDIPYFLDEKKVELEVEEKKVELEVEEKKAFIDDPVASRSVNKSKVNNDNFEKKNNLIEFESMFLPFFDEIKETNEIVDNNEIEKPVYITQRGLRAKRRLPYTTRFGNRY
jgi:hypothetical protein